MKALLLRMKAYWAVEHYENALRDAMTALALIDGKELSLKRNGKVFKLKRQIRELEVRKLYVIGGVDFDGRAREKEEACTH